MKLVRVLLLLSLSLACWAAQAAGPTAAEPLKPPAPDVWETGLSDFSDADYGPAVERVMAGFEAEAGAKALKPGAHRSVGLKVYSESGAGLGTPPALVRAVISALVRRGFAPDRIFIVGRNEGRLRETGFLPALSRGGERFDGHPVLVLESQRHYDPVWFYESPLPAPYPTSRVKHDDPDVPTTDLERLRKDSAAEDRKSFLPAPLFLDTDFWINLPVYSDHPVIGLSGALANATLWNASNTQRFCRSPASAPTAIAEMAAIPELHETWRLTIVSLEHYQYIGGPLFNSLYTKSEPRLWLSADPVLLDSLMLNRLNAARKREHFPPLFENDRRLFEYAQQLGLGTAETKSARWHRP
jgi:hypothetical protein